jgi:hypothetical protein
MSISSTRSSLSSSTVSKLTSEFYSIDTDHKGFITLAQVLDYFSTHDQIRLSKEVCQEVFYTIDSNRDNTISLEEFQSAHELAEKRLKKELDDLAEQQSDQKEKLDEKAAQYLEIQNYENFNEFGLSFLSQAIISEIYCRHLVATNDEGLCNPYVRIECENQHFRTKTLFDSINPRWEEEFRMEIVHGTELLKIFVRHHDVEGNEDLLGRCSISIAKFRDQQKHVEKIHLSGPNPHKDYGEIFLHIQWIWNFTQFLHAQIVEEAENLKRISERLVSAEQHMATLNGPLGLFQVREWIYLVDDWGEEEPDWD